MTPAQTLIEHYARASFADDVDASLRALGKDLASITADDLEPMDEFHTGGRPATRALFEAAGFARGTRILDVGSGLGGPARFGASAFGLMIEGIDLTPAYVDVANEFSSRLGLAEQTRFVAGNALALPYADHTFAGAYTIHVGMNIADKCALAREVRRVLRESATYAIYDIMRVGEGALTFPLPWSSAPETSAVATPEDYRAALIAAGFEIVSERDCRPLLRQIVANMGAAAASPNMSIRGPGWTTKVENLGSLVRNGVLAPTIMVARVRQT
jgi:ubiquinone/menaquinone biosynthesis C-methylase UbiE